jgi:hypothetical protein
MATVYGKDKPAVIVWIIDIESAFACSFSCFSHAMETGIKNATSRFIE